MKHIPEDQAEIASISNQVMRRFATRKTTTMRKFSLLLRFTQLAQQCLIVLVVLSSIQLLLPFNAVNCQDFEDLTSKQLGNHQLAQHSFQPQHSNRQPQQQSLSSSSSSSSSSSTTRQRPILSSRFAPSYTGNSNNAVNSAGNQQLLAQASSSANVFSAPPSALSQLQQQQQQLQQSSSASAAGTSGANGGSGSVSNIEQLMKNALARTAQMNSAAAVEPRQEIASTSGNSNAPSQPEQPAAVQSLSRSSQAAQVQQQAAAAALREADKTAESSNTAPDSASASDDESKLTTASQATTASGHETVYSDQRFANLFARRNSAKKSRITPAEQVKAKPTLPSFIKSLPDPKQFSAAQAAASAAEKPPTSASSSSFASQRLQQANQNRINQANQQKKAVITSTSAANASNKRANALNGKQVSSTASPKLTSANQKSTTNKPVVTPSSNNPFNRSQSSNSDPANVIAMARKRLLANNALETAKLKQQQSKPAN